MVEGNLLRQGDISCQLALDDAQLAAVTTATQGLSHKVGIETYSLTSRAAEFVQAVNAWPWR